MRLSSDLLYDNLKATFQLEAFGPRIEKLTLIRPEFHVGPQFAANSVSVAHYNMGRIDPVEYVGVSQ